MDNSEMCEAGESSGCFADGGDIRGAMLEALWNLRSQLDWMAENGVRDVPRPTVTPAVVAQSASQPRGTMSSASSASKPVAPLSAAFVTSVPTPASVPPQTEPPRVAQPSQQPHIRPTPSHPSVAPVAGTFEALTAYAAQCSECPMGGTKASVLVGNGIQKSDLMLVGDRPVVLPDGRVSLFEPEVMELLTKMIRAIGRDIRTVACIDAVQCACRGEMHFMAPQKCRPILWSAVNLVRPKVIISLGKVATQALLDVPTPITRLRGVWQSHSQIHIMPTYHPAYLLKHVAAKREAWEDLKQVMKVLSEP